MEMIVSVSHWVRYTRQIILRSPMHPELAELKVQPNNQWYFNLKNFRKNEKDIIKCSCSPLSSSSPSFLLPPPVLPFISPFSVAKYSKPILFPANKPQTNLSQIHERKNVKKSYKKEIREIRALSAQQIS